MYCNVIIMFGSYYASCFFQLILIVVPLMTIGIAIFSKIIFLRSFRHCLWGGFFIASMIFSVIAILLYYASIYTFGESGLAYIFGAGLFHFLTILYFASYIVDFILRLIRHKKQKNRVIAEETKID